MSLLSRMSCAHHGECVHLKGRCVHCHPVERRAPAQGSDVNTPIGAKRRERPAMYRGVSSGRPRAVDLTARERAIATLFASGVTQAEIGKQLGIARNTVCSMLGRARERIGADRADELVKYMRAQP
jgi:DNA-binding CsgD family transcriptional regulator